MVSLQAGLLQCCGHEIRQSFHGGEGMMVTAAVLMTPKKEVQRGPERRYTL
jgi:hypothetical protein